jgi:hypothetical protein
MYLKGIWWPLVVASICSGVHIPTTALAKIIRLEVRSTIPFGSFRPGDYLRLEGRIAGELSPASEAIPDLDKAPRNARGMVEYSGQIVIIMPADPAKGNGALLIDVPNRGRPISHFLYNSPRDLPLLLGPTVDQGTGFLEDQGYIVAAPSWELGQGAELSTFTDSDGKPRYVEGVGFAIIRDTADFLATASVDSTGQPNPIAGAVSRTLAIGYSQTGRLLKTALLNGFNMVEGHRAFAGMHIFGAAAGQLPILRSSVGPKSSAEDVIPSFAQPDVRGFNEEPLAMGEIIERVRASNETPPRLLVVNTSADYISLRASLARTGANGMEDLPIPENVRVYDIAGASHLLVRSGDCKLPIAFLDWHPVLRATLLALDQWVANNVEPPESRLMPLEQRANDNTILPAPAHLPKAVIQVPINDQDGNPVGGVRLPDIAVPLGTHAGQGPRRSFVCSLGFLCPPGKERARARCQESISERYKDRNDYINRVRVAGRELVSARLLLPEDWAIIVHSAAEAPAFK